MCIRPATEGVTIFIENQTNEFLYIVEDSLKVNSYLQCYDTAYIHGQQYIAAKGNYIAPFSKYGYLLRETQMKHLANQQKQAKSLYIISGGNCKMITDSIIQNHLFRKADIFYKNLNADSTYYLFIWKDKTKFTSDFDWEKRK